MIFSSFCSLNISSSSSRTILCTVSDSSSSFSPHPSTILSCSIANCAIASSLWFIAISIDVASNFYIIESFNLDMTHKALRLNEFSAPHSPQPAAVPFQANHQGNYGYRFYCATRKAAIKVKHVSDLFYVHAVHHSINMQITTVTTATSTQQITSNRAANRHRVYLL